MACNYEESLDNYAKQRYTAKLRAAGLQLCPYKHPAEAWKDESTSWPGVEYGDIYCFLIESPGPFTQGTMKNYKSLEAFQFFRSGWVQTVYSQETAKGKVLLKALVRPPQGISDPPCNPWVAVDPNGTIVAAHCDCMAGLDESCSHIAAVLFKIEANVRLGYTTVAGTDTTCNCNTCFVSEVKPSPIAQIRFYPEAVKATDRPRKRKHIPSATLQDWSEADRLKFINSFLDCDEKPVGLSLFSETCKFFIPKTTPDPQCEDPHP